MSYALLTELKSRLGSNVDPPGLYEQLTDRIHALVGDDIVGQELLAMASGEVDGWLAQRYAVPVNVSTDATLAQRLRGVTLDIAEHGAWQTSTRRIATPKRVRDKYEAAIKWLMAVAHGETALPGDSKIPAATADGPRAAVIGHQRVFTESALRDL